MSDETHPPRGDRPEQSAREIPWRLVSWIAIAVYTVVFTGSMTAGSLLWGFVAEGWGLQVAFLIAAFVMLAGVIAGLVWRVPETGHLDPQPVVYWPAARLALDPEADAGPARAAGSCSGTETSRTASSRCSACLPGRNTSTST